MARLRLLGGPAEEIAGVVIEAEPTHRYAYGSLLRPWGQLLTCLPRQLREAVIVESPGVRYHPRYPYGVIEFERRIPPPVCDQLSIEEVQHG